LAQEHLEEVLVVPDEETVKALKFILERLKILKEPVASCTLSAALRLRDQFNNNNNLVLIFCGGNLSVEDLCKYDARI
jgi:threonine dehydratase